MIEEILNSIKQAELKAEEIKAEAEQQASDLLLKTSEDGEALIKKATEEVKKLKAENLANAEKSANKIYDESIQKAQESANKQKEDLNSTIISLGEEIYGRILNGNL